MKSFITVSKAYIMWICPAIISKKIFPRRMRLIKNQGHGDDTAIWTDKKKPRPGSTQELSGEGHFDSTKMLEQPFWKGQKQYKTWLGETLAGCLRTTLQGGKIRVLL